MVRELFRTVPEDPEAEIILDRAHRALGPRSADPSRPRDFICRLHRYAQKGKNLRRAWDHRDVEMADSQVKILPDLSRVTLRSRALLWPLLDLAKQKATDLPAPFRYLEAEPFQVPNWLQLLPRPPERSGPSAQHGPLPPCQQRGRRRNWSPSREEPCEYPYV